MADRVRAVKQESTATGGKDGDVGVYGAPRPLNPNEDGLDTRAVFYQNDTSADGTVEISRDSSDNMTFKDGVVVGTKTLTQLLDASGFDVNIILVNVDGSVLTNKDGNVLVSG